MDLFIFEFDSNGKDQHLALAKGLKNWSLSHQLLPPNRANVKTWDRYPIVKVYVTIPSIYTNDETKQFLEKIMDEAAGYDMTTLTTYRNGREKSQATSSVAYRLFHGDNEIDSGWARFGLHKKMEELPRV